MKIAFCYESVLPSRGGCETYIASLARRLAADGHELHLYACRWDSSALPAGMHYHPVSFTNRPRFLRPWAFGSACRKLLKQAKHDVTVGFDKISGLDVLYPQGGLYAASVDHNPRKHASPFVQRAVRVLRWLDPAHHSFLALERAQYRNGAPLVVAISDMVRGHFQHYLGFSSSDLRVVRIAANPDRFDECDRPRRRVEWRQQWNLEPSDVAALFVGINYRLKGLEPLLRSLALVKNRAVKLLVAGKPEVKPYQRLAARLGIADRVRFLGYLADMRNGYFASDFLVHPTFYDPCSNVVVEALACGLPVITTAYNGAGELLHTSPRPTLKEERAEGYIIDDPHAHERLAWCMDQLGDSARRQACSQAARKAAALWTFEHHYRDLLAVFNEAAARKRRAA